MKSIPEKFEDLSQDEIMFFAKLGFNFYQSYKQCFERAMDPTHIYAVTQPISDEQKRFMQELNANNQRIIESLNSSVKL